MGITSKLWLASLDKIFQSWKQVLLIHLVYTALGFILFSPLVAGAGWLLLKVSGRFALDDQDIVYFFISPYGMFALVLISALLIIGLVFEQAALMYVAVAVEKGKSSNVIDALLFNAARIKPLFVFVLRLVSRIFLLAVPFLALAFGIAWWLITDYDINYYLVQKPPEFYWGITLVGLVLISLLVLLSRKLIAWSLALPLVLFANVPPQKSFARSQVITSGNRVMVFLTLLVWLVLGVLLGLLLLAAIWLVGMWAVPTVKSSLPLLLIILGGFSLLWALGNFLITAFTSASFAYLLVGICANIDSGFNALSMPANQPESMPGKLQFTFKNIMILLLTGVTAAGLTGMWLVDSIQPNDKVTIIAHRGGAAGKAPENTLAAFRQAIEDKADWIELDVQETVDGEVVVFHDSDFMKLAGNETRLWQASLSEVQAIDIGSWFDPAFSNERVPTLKEALETARGKTNVVIELKYYGHDQMLEQRVVEIVEASGMVDKTAIMSLRYPAIKKLRDMKPDWRLGLLSATAIGDLTRLDADFLAVQTRMARAGFIRRAHDSGKKVFVWTVNDAISMSRMMSLGVDGIITDEPELARLVLQQRKEMNIAERLLIHTAVLFGRPYTPRQFRDDSP